MLRYSQFVGLPDDDDPNAITLWRVGLTEKLNTLPQAVRNAISEDDTGFYARLFAQFYRIPETPAETPLEQAFSQAFQQQPQINEKSFSTPTIVWHDEMLAVELPAGQSVDWQICIDQQRIEQTDLNEPRLVHLPECLITEIQITCNGKPQTYPLWTSLQNNALLLFSQQGVLIKATDFSQDSVALEPEHYSVVSRFAPEMDDFICLDEERDLYQWEIDLAPGEILTLRRGLAQLKLYADSKPVLSWQGDSYKPARGVVFFASQGLQLRIQIPTEWLQDDTPLVLHLVANTLGDAQDIVLEYQDDASITLALESYFKHWKKGFTRLLAELRRQDSNRSLARTSIYLWNGLQNVQQGYFAYAAAPSNLDPENCDNAQQDPEGIGFKDAYNRFFQLVFKLSDKRSLNLTCSVPGIFLYLETETVYGWQEKPLRKGSTLAVGSQRRDMLRIYSSESGQLSLGDLHKMLDARRNAALRLPLSSLDTYLTPQHNTLEFLIENHKIAEPLLKLITPQETLFFNAGYEAGCYRLDFSLHEEIEMLALDAVNLLDGRQQSLELNINDVSVLQQQHS